ncbi:hypothetical protein L493_3381 [Bordetella bronchiseptica 99-R-0433]|nr:hypothetical protein L493_3381 [Bordetella bronchiseptica 99-R-0433]
MQIFKLSNGAGPLYPEPLLLHHGALRSRKNGRIFRPGHGIPGLSGGFGLCRAGDVIMLNN